MSVAQTNIQALAWKTSKNVDLVLGGRSVLTGKKSRDILLNEPD